MSLSSPQAHVPAVAAPLAAVASFASPSSRRFLLELPAGQRAAIERLEHDHMGGEERVTERFEIITLSGWRS